MEEVNQLAERMGFKVNHCAKYRAIYYLVDKDGNKVKNDRNETLIVEVSACHTDPNNKKSLPNIWHKKGFTKELTPNYWVFDTFITREDGTCYGGYNPEHKLSDDGKRVVLNFDWVFNTTVENFEKLMREILRLFYNGENSF